MGFLSAVGGLFQSEEDRNAGNLNALQRFGNALNDDGQAAARTPSAILEWNAFNSMTPEQQKKYLLMKRAQPLLNQGNQYSAYDPIGGQVAPVATINPRPGEMPDFQAEQTRRKKEAELLQTNKTEAEIMLPSILSTGENTLKYLEEMVGSDALGIQKPDSEKIKQHPGLNSAIGTIDAWLPTLQPDTADFETRLEQVKGTAFLEALSKMKGTGAISEVEGKAGTAAVARMQKATSEEGFKAAAKDYYDVVRAGMKRAQEKAGVTTSPNAAPSDGMAEMPPASAHKGKIIRNTATGERFQSDGTTWRPM